MANQVLVAVLAIIVAVQLSTAQDAVLRVGEQYPNKAARITREANSEMLLQNYDGSLSMNEGLALPLVMNRLRRNLAPINYAEPSFPQERAKRTIGLIFVTRLIRFTIRVVLGVIGAIRRVIRAILGIGKRSGDYADAFDSY